MSWAPLVLFRRLPAVPRLLLLSQLAFNVGFYLVVPFLAVHLTEDLALSGGVIGLVLGVRTFSQQGLFFLGGGLADRFGVKPMVLLGCTIRITGFLVLAAVTSLPGVLLGPCSSGSPPRCSHRRWSRRSPTRGGNWRQPGWPPARRSSGSTPSPASSAR